MSEPVGLVAAVGASGMPDVTWSAVLPAVTRHPGGTYRVLLQEFEVHPTDDGDTDDPFGAQAVWGDHGEAKKKYWRNDPRGGLGLPGGLAYAA